MALVEGEMVMALVKAPGVLLGKGGSQANVSARNCLPGRVTGIRRDGVAVEVMGVLTDGTPMCALCTADSLQRLDIRPDDQVWFFFKALSLILSAENPRHELPSAVHP